MENKNNLTSNSWTLFNVTTGPAVAQIGDYDFKVSNVNMDISTTGNGQLAISQLQITEEQWLGNEI